MSDEEDDEVPKEDNNSPEGEFVNDETTHVDVSLGEAHWVNAKGAFLNEADYRVGGDVWRVHKGDADPFPSKPHAHLIAGQKRFVGCKLHLGTAELYNGTRGLGRFLYKHQFERLITLIRPKFPDVKLPLDS